MVNHSDIIVIMPVFNAGSHIKMAIESILFQTYSDFTLAILDDGSTDDTVQIIQSFDDERIHFIQHAKNNGITESLNTLLSSFRGKYYIRMDADDIAHLQRLEKQIYFMDTHPDIDICGSWIWFFGEQESIWKTKETHIEISKKLLYNNALAHPSIIIRGAIVHDNLPLYADSFVSNGGFEDYELWLRLAPYVCFHNLQDALLDRRVSGIKDIDKEARQNFFEAFFKQIGISNYQKLARIHNYPYTQSKITKADWLEFEKSSKEIMEVYLSYLANSEMTVSELENAFNTYRKSWIRRATKVPIKIKLWSWFN